MNKAVVIVGGPGTGKTQLAPAFMDHFNCPDVVDEWGGGRVAPHTLYLTQQIAMMEVPEDVELWVVEINYAKRLIKAQDADERKIR